MPRRMLIVEDEAPLCALLRDIFTDEGYEVITAAAGREGWDRLAAGGFDLVLANMMLPYVDGRELLARVCADPALRHTPVILMSANPPATAASGGAAAFVTKPFQLDELLAIIARVIDTAYP